MRLTCVLHPSGTGIESDICRVTIMSTINYQMPPVRTPGPEQAQPKRGRDRRDLSSRERLVERVTAEFREMPCLRLTSAQAQRLFGLRPDVCDRIITELIRDGLLRLDPDGRYAVAAH
jgi:hypothetical protein